MRLFEIIGNKPEPVAIIGIKGVETGMAITIKEIDSQNKVIDGIELKGYSGQRLEWNGDRKTTAGIGITKPLNLKGLVKLDTGVYVTQTVKDFLNPKNINIGIGVSVKF